MTGRTAVERRLKRYAPLLALAGLQLLCAFLVPSRGRAPERPADRSVPAATVVAGAP